MRGFRFVAAVLATLAVFGCNKSQGSKPTNLFGASPGLSQFLISKERKQYRCSDDVLLCCADPGCTCCCIPDTITEGSADIDLVTATVKASDPTGPSQLLVVVLSFLDPPPSLAAGSAAVQQIRLEMFDTGPGPVGVTEKGTSIFSGDLVAGDGIYTRKFYFKNTTLTGSGDGGCIDKSNQTTLGGTFSTYSAIASLETLHSVEYRFTSQAVDRDGNLTTSAEVPLVIQETFLSFVLGLQRPCGPMLPSGGCLPGP